MEMNGSGIQEGGGGGGRPEDWVPAEARRRNLEGFWLAGPGLRGASTIWITGAQPVQALSPSLLRGLS